METLKSPKISSSNESKTSRSSTSRKNSTRSGSEISVNSEISKLSTQKSSSSQLKLDEATSVSQTGGEKLKNNEDYRKSVTDSFFDCLIETIVVERKLINMNGSISSSNDVQTPSLRTISEKSVFSIVDNSSNSSRNIDKINSKTSNISKQSETFISTENDSELIHRCPSDCSCIWKIVFTNGNVYKGHLNGDNLMEGKGEFHWSDGSIYKGDFQDCYPTGKGSIILPDLSTYEGDFCNGFFHGNGLLNIKSTTVFYRGEWTNSCKNGNGYLFYDKDNWYEGGFINNIREGTGTRHYKNGTNYNGNWLNDKTSGEGRMIWNNNDYYSGNWSDGYQNGYGEYFWNLIPQDGLVFALYNSYKGNWIDGKRNGIGIMNFGYTSGATLAGTWEMDRKHGPGIMICGNGRILQRNPLFSNDKSSAYRTKRANANATANNDSVDDSLSNNPFDYRLFKIAAEQIEAKEKLMSFNDEIIAELNNGEKYIKMSQYVKLLEPGVTCDPPLKIQIHDAPENVDLSYFVQLLLEWGEPEVMDLKDKPLCWCDTSICDNRANNDSADSDNNDTKPKVIALKVEELKNLIAIHLLHLQHIYKMYAGLCLPNEKLKFEPVLIRLFLWQLFRDIGVTDEGGVTLVDIDQLLSDNPKSCLDSKHDPWEVIYFWQYLQALVGACFLLHRKEHGMKFKIPFRFLYFTFSSFLEKRLFSNAGKIRGNCLTCLKDVIPIKPFYELYKKIGEPHTVKVLLQLIYKDGEAIYPCHEQINSNSTDDNGYYILRGSNVVGLNNNVYFTTESEVYTPFTEHKKCRRLEIYNSLEKKQVLKSISDICPLIIDPETKRYDLDYKLLFIEFYEIILQLSYDKVQQARLLLLPTETNKEEALGI